MTAATERGDGAGADARARIGEILTEAGLLTQERLADALAVQRETGERLGYVLIRMGLVPEALLIQALSRQLSVPWVSIARLDVTDEIMQAVPLELVTRHGIVPVYVMRKRAGERVLYIAMDDPTNDRVLGDVQRACGMETRPMIAAPSEIARAIRSFYGAAWETGERLGAPLAAPRPRAEETEAAPPRGEEAAAPPPLDEPEVVELAEEPEPTPADAPAGEKEPPRETVLDGPGIPPGAWQEQAAAPDEAFAAPEEPTERRPLAFTFLDGVTITLGGGRPSLQPGAPGGNALLRRVAGYVSSEHAPPRVTALLCGILEVLLRKGLMTLDEIENLIGKDERA